MSASRFSSCLSSRVGVPFVSRGLAFSCRRWRFASRSASRPVLSRRSVLSGVSCRRCPIAPFLSARVSVLSRLVSSLPSFYSCSSRRACRIAACRVAGRWGVAGGGAWLMGSRRCGVAWRCACRGCVALWRIGGRFGDAVSCGVVCVAGRGAGRMARREAGRWSRRFCQLVLVVPVLSLRSVGPRGVLGLSHRELI